MVVGSGMWDVGVGRPGFRWPQAKLQAVIPAKRAFGSREPVQTGAVSVARACRKEQW